MPDETTPRRRRLPLTESELNRVKRTGELPFADDPPAATPWCHNCKFWTRENDYMGLCSYTQPKIEWAVQNHPFDKKGTHTGESAVCGFHEFKQPNFSNNEQTRY
jgi:hypothetical protein